jgi:HD superfamily phosphohydrolase
LRRGESALITSNDQSRIDLDNVSLLIVGRSSHPFTQFLADIVTSDFDADKLDYLLRDASAAGLPLKYDLERYLSTVRVETDHIPDDEKRLQELYNVLGASVERKPADPKISEFEYYEMLVLRLPKQAMSTIEQIVICKFMLYSYIYHHRKVRAAEGLLARLLRRAVISWRADGLDDSDLISKFLDLSDPSLYTPEFTSHKDTVIRDYCHRVNTRLLPREVVGFVPNMSVRDRARRLKRLY